MSQKWLFDILSKLTSTALVIWRHGGLNKRCSRCGSAHTRHHMITYLKCYPMLLLETLEISMTLTSCQPWGGDKAFCFEPSFALVHVWELFSIVFGFMHWWDISDWKVQRADTNRNRGRLQSPNSIDRLCICWEWEHRKLVLVPRTSEDSCCCRPSRYVAYKWQARRSATSNYEITSRKWNNASIMAICAKQVVH